MSIELRETPVVFSGGLAFVDVHFSGPVRNVEAMVKGAGKLSAIKVIGNKVRLAASLRRGESSRSSEVLVMADTVPV